MRASIQQKTVVVLVFIAVCVLTVFAIAYRSATVFVDNSRLVAHTYEVIATLDSTQSDLSDAVADAREYYFTGNGSYRAAHNSVIRQVQSDIAQLARLTADNPIQQTNVSTLRGQVEQVFETENRHLTLPQTRGGPASGATSAMSGARQTIARMKAEEQRLLSIRQENVTHSTQISALTFSVVGVFQLLLLVLIYYLMARDVQERQKSENALRKAEDRLRTLVGDVLLSPEEVPSSFTPALAAGTNTVRDRLQKFEHPVPPSEIARITGISKATLIRSCNEGSLGKSKPPLPQPDRPRSRQRQVNGLLGA